MILTIGCSNGQHFEKAFELDPQYALACRNLGDIYLRQGKSTPALHWLKTAVDLDPGNMRGQYWLGKAFYLSGEFAAAKDQYLRILVNKPNLHSVLVKEVMTKSPISINKDELAAKALSLMNSKKITSLCVYEKNNKTKTIGILHIHNILKTNIS